MKYLSVLLAAVTLSGCYNSKKAVRQVDKAILEYPEVAAGELRKAFPCKVTPIDTVLTYGDTTFEINCPETYINDTVYKVGSNDTIIRVQYQNKIVKVPVTLPIKTRTIIQQVKDETCDPIIKGLQDKVAQLTTDKEKFRGKFNMWKWIAIGLMAVITVWGIFKVKSLF